ncbi:CBS domain-containing protein [Nesterenkonia halotolerans]|uniref:Transcriptional regulator n=1 Tax=Nesterenkonia halotolerans TaxID=225325 RepID=A0ABR9J855_9MICC|nr:CBS domain-containing protein [Nesterenkonia halotolerans]MBE1515165.1 putative transcriptional regulator [Nesterenkonia halotolerans]
MSAVPRSVWMTQSLADAVSLFDHQTPAGLVVDLRDHPVGLITKAAVARVAARNPDRWSRIRCAHLMEPLTSWLHPDDSVQRALACYRDDGPRPLLVFNGDHPTGMLYPEYVLASTPASDRTPTSTPGVESTLKTP